MANKDDITTKNACNSLLQGMDSPVSIIESCDKEPIQVTDDIYTFEMCVHEDDGPRTGKGPGGRGRPGDRHRFRVVVFKLPIEQFED